MGAFVVRRALYAVVVLAFASFASFTFFAANFLPLKGHAVLPEYWQWVKGLGTGRSYHSLLDGSSLLPVVLPALGHTAALLFGAMVVVVVLSLGVGVAAARWRGSVADPAVRGVTYLAWAIPAFLLALVVQQLVSNVGTGQGLGPFPIAGWPGSCPTGIGIDAGTFLHCPAAGSGPMYVVNMLRYLMFPTLVLALGFVGLHGRHLRAQLLEALHAPYITTARAKGLSEHRVITRHALRASLATFLGVLLSDFGTIFGAALAVDWVFQLNGLGTLLIHEFPEAPFAPIDTYSLELVLLITAFLVLLMSLLGELTVAWLDPRARAEQ